MQDYIEIGDNFAIVRTTPNSAVIGKPLGEAQVRAKYGVTITAYKPAGKPWNYTTPETVIEPGGMMLVSGPTAKAEAFSQLR
jgi:trk system potassium uptake protein TrkA